MSDRTILNPPTHVGIIMDGNGRWATARNKDRSYGHKQGAKTIKDVALSIFDAGVKYLSLYAFSTENFKRPKKEVDELFSILNKGIAEYGELALKQGIKLIVSGDISALDDQLQNKILEFEQKTAKFNQPVLNICLNYGAKQELCRAFSLMVKQGIVNPDEKTVDKFLFKPELPPVDLVIRTGGEHRLSNFLLWQSAYAEIYFCDLLWPDFNKEEAVNALLWYQSRNRRFGNV